jgi:hypothetical protein
MQRGPAVTDSMKWYRKLPFPVLSVLLSLGLGLGLWLTHITDESVAIITALLLEMVIVVHRILALVERGADPLHGLLRTAKIEEALTFAAQVIRSQNRQAQALLEETVSAFCTRVKRLQSGGVQLSPVEFMEFADRIFAAAKSDDRLYATSHLAGGTYWQKAYGQQYERLNRQAQARGLTIERIYVLRDKRHLDEVRHVLDRQAAFSSIRTVLLDEHETDGTLTVPRRDFFVYNREATAEFVFVEPNMTVEHIHIATDADHVREMFHEYTRIRDHFSAPYQASTNRELPS